MLRVNLITPFKTTSFAQQFIKNLEHKCELIENGPNNVRYNAIIIYEDILKPINIKTYKGNLIFISGEPPLSRRYSQSFLNQFDYIISCHTNIKHKNNILSQQCLPWQFGYDYTTHNYKYDFNSLIKMPLLIKKKKMSIISSGKSMMPGHKQRLKFTEKLKQYFSNQIDFFGRDSNPIKDKADAILPYKMSICIENSSIDDYWTEKLADTFLGYTLPIYYGCSNIENYFSSQSIIKLNINNLDESLENISNLILNCDDIYNKHLNYVVESRSLLLNKYNIHPFLSNFYNENNLGRNTEPFDFIVSPTFSFKEYYLQRAMIKFERFVKKNYYGK